MYVIHLFSALYQGGAENQFELIFADDNFNGTHHLVVSLKSEETVFSKRIQSKGIPVYFFDFSGFKSIKSFVRLFLFVRKYCCNNNHVVLHCWMYHANLVGWLISIFNRINLIWSIRRTAIPSGLTGLIARFCSLASYLGPKRIISNSYSGKRSHELIYYRNSIQVIQNGFDVSTSKDFNISNIVSNEFRFVHVGRFSTEKGQVELFDAAIIFLQNLSSSDLSRVSFTFIGRNVEEALMDKLELTRFKQNFFFLGEISSPRDILSNYSCYVLSSKSEGFPNSLVEAMLEFLPCIASDVGDVAKILVDKEFIYPPDNPENLVYLFHKIYQTAPDVLCDIGVINNKKAVKYYDIHTVRDKYNTLYKEVIK